MPIICNGNTIDTYRKLTLPISIAYAVATVKSVKAWVAHGSMDTSSWSNRSVFPEQLVVLVCAMPQTVHVPCGSATRRRFCVDVPLLPEVTSAG